MAGLIDTRQKELQDFWYEKGEAESLLFPPKYSDAAEAKTALLQTIRQAPTNFDYTCSRWTLDMLAETCSWLKLNSPSALSQLLKRLGIRYKRGREYVHSPDPNYQAKVNLIKSTRFRARLEPERYPFLYLDELTYYRQPSVSRAYEERGKTQPLARRSHHSNTHARVLGAMNAETGQVTYCQRSKTNIPCLVNFWYKLRQDYPDAERIYIVVDNWPLHFHPDVLAPLQEQNFPFPPRLPGHWSTEPSRKAKADNLPIQLLSLPTYASWLNPIEKLWRWLKQDILHLHRQSNDWQQLKQRVEQFLNRFSEDSPALLRYTGLSPV